MAPPPRWSGFAGGGDVGQVVNPPFRRLDRLTTRPTRPRQALRSRSRRSKGPLQIAQLAPELGIRNMRGKLIGLFQPAPDLRIDLVLVFVVVGQCAGYLSQPEVWVLKMDLLRTRSVGDHIHHDL